MMHHVPWLVKNRVRKHVLQCFIEKWLAHHGVPEMEVVDQEANVNRDLHRGVKNSESTSASLGRGPYGMAAWLGLRPR